MLYFVYGFISAVLLCAALVSIAHSIEKSDAKDYFKVYYTRGNDYFTSTLDVPKYGIRLRGPMADDVYRWLTKGLKGDNNDD